MGGNLIFKGLNPLELKSAQSVPVFNKDGGLDLEGGPWTPYGMIYVTVITFISCHPKMSWRTQILSFFFSRWRRGSSLTWTRMILCWLKMRPWTSLTLYYTTSPAVSEVRSEDSTGSLVLEELQLKNVSSFFIILLNHLQTLSQHTHTTPHFICCWISGLSFMFIPFFWTSYCFWWRPDVQSTFCATCKVFVDISRKAGVVKQVLVLHTGCIDKGKETSANIKGSTRLLD